MLDLRALVPIVRSGPTPLFATVSGAHLYGFESPDSDVDIRGVFVLPTRQVIGLSRPEETLTISRVDDGLEIDWVAHDVAKFVSMMTRRNGYVLEQLYSPLVVLGGEWHERLMGLGQGCVVRPLYHHYRGFFANQRKLLSAAQPTVKQLLYAYRVALSGIHVLQQGRIEAHLPTLCQTRHAPWIDALLERKRRGAEHGPLDPTEMLEHGARLDGLDQELEAAYEGSTLPEEPTTVEELDDFVVQARLGLGPA
jgi:hypothetical protein